MTETAIGTNNVSDEEKKKKRPIFIVGHKNPDTDSICSSISYAYLKNQISDELHVPCRAGEVSRETKFALKYFGAEKPKLLTDVSPQISDIDIRRQQGIDAETSMRAAYIRMRDEVIDTLCIIDEDNSLEGLITIKDIANANMDLFDTSVLAAANTSYRNILSTLEAKMVLGDPDDRITEGRIMIGSSPEVMDELVEEGDIVMVSNRYEVQVCAIDLGASCIIVCADSTVPRTILMRAKERNCKVIITHYDSYAAARLISMATPVRHFMTRDGLLTFGVKTAVDEARKVMSEKRHRYFPILDKNGKYCGVISRRNFLGMHRKKVILVDHNERSQAVDGLEDAEILEIIDHHRIGSLETGGPVYFRNVPVGCTATILTSMFDENAVEIPQNIAGLLLSAILSDTLLFRSPTCTPMDRMSAERLAKIAGVNVEEYAEKMFEAGDDLTGRDADNILFSDFKEFIFGKERLGVGQGLFMSRKSIEKAEEMVSAYLDSALDKTDLPMIFYMLTDMRTQSTTLLYAGKNTDEIVSKAYGVEAKDGKAILEGVVSRKKQMIPPLNGVL